MHGKVITAGGQVGTAALAFALAGFAGQARSDNGTCDAAWPNYASSCLKTSEGEALGKQVRFVPISVDPRFDDHNHFPEQGSGHRLAISVPADGRAETSRTLQ